MYFCQIGEHGRGFTNQIFALIVSIILTKRGGDRLIIVDRFLNDFSKHTSTPISLILDLPAFNKLLDQYGVIVVDREDPVEFISATYGSGSSIIDLTKALKARFFQNGELTIPRETHLNSIAGDPCQGTVKQMTIRYRVYGREIEEVYNETLNGCITLDFTHAYYDPNWWGVYNALTNSESRLFENILRLIPYHNDFHRVVASIPLGRAGINVLHLRVEDDGIKHWSNQNGLDSEIFREIIEKRYIEIIKRYVKKTQSTIILSHSSDNTVIDFLKREGYTYILHERYYDDDRERNAIIDLLLARKCTNLFIGAGGSTFTHYISKTLPPNIRTVLFDLNKIQSPDTLINCARTLVLFVFHEINARVASFIRHAIFEDPFVDFIVISNNKTNLFEVPPYVRVLQRDNIGYDFGGWSDGLLTDDLYKDYSSFIFVNSSVIGPFMRPGDTRRWTDVYLEGLVGDVRLFGSTINTCRRPMTHSHVQSYIFAMGRQTLEYLIECGIFSMTDYVKTFDDAINKREIGMSRRLIERGWNIGSLMTYYRGVDFTFSNRQPEALSLIFLDDPMGEHCYNRLWNEYDLVFVKGNRGFAVAGVPPGCTQQSPAFGVGAKLCA